MNIEDKRAKNAARMRKWRAANRAQARLLYKRQNTKRRKAVSIYNRERTATHRTWLNAIKQERGCCTDCGGIFPPCCMDFDHRDPNTKSFSIGSVVRRSKARLLEEIDKCDLVCANCHRIRTHMSNAQAVVRWHQKTNG